MPPKENTAKANVNPSPAVILPKHIPSILKKIFFFFLLLTIIAGRMQARPVSHKIQANAGSAKLDTMLIHFNRKMKETEKRGIAKLAMEVYIKGNSHATRRGTLCKLIPNLLPFESGTGETFFEALCQISYQTPCNQQITPIAFRSNSRKGVKLLREIYPVLFPFYTISLRKDERYYVFPFTDDGLDEYEYSLQDTLNIDGKRYYRIGFRPRVKHHFLLEGNITVDPENGQTYSLNCSGRIDFGKFRMEMIFSNYGKHSVPIRSLIVVDYNYAGCSGTNTYECLYSYKQFLDKVEFNEKSQSLNLTDVYKNDPLQKVNWDSIRPLPLSPKEEKELETPTINKNKQGRSLYQAIPERLMSSSNINAFGTDLKISGPLDPAAIGYDKFNGVSIREKLRWSYLFNNGQSIIVRPQIGYNFGIKEIRYKLTAEWIFYPERRCGLQLYAANRNSGFSSKFIDVVNNALDSVGTKFKDLGIDYYHHYETRIEQSFEITNGLMAYAGLLYNYRNPVKRGTRAISPEHLDDLVQDHYADLNPYLRLEWTPRLYYHYRGRQKLYIASYYPTFSLELTKGVNGILGSKGNYFRTELDVEQGFPITTNRRLSYHVGIGAFFRQQGEYFVNYRYFSRGQYPESWNDNIGGTFHLLDDYWYSSTPGYLQSHVMYESPFLLLHQVKAVSKYSIKERIYLSALYARNKNSYTEIGYGMGNNYFNIGIFSGFVGLDFMDLGIKATLEIDQHW